MARLRMQHYRLYVWPENKFTVISTVEQKVELNFRMALRNTLKAFVGKQPHPFQFVFNKEACVYGYFFRLGQGVRIFHKYTNSF